MYVSFFNGRPTSTEEMEGWGTDGPIVGPVKVSITYGGLKLHSDWDDDFVIVPMDDDCFLINGVCYGDAEVWEDSDELLQKSKNKERIITFKEFEKCFQ